MKGEQTQKFSFSFSEFIFGPSMPENLANNLSNEMKLDKIDEVCIHFLSDVFGFLSFRNFAPMTT